MTSHANQVPVIVGVGEINDRPRADHSGLDSVELMAAALWAAQRRRTRRLDRESVLEYMSCRRSHSIWTFR